MPEGAELITLIQAAEEFGVHRVTLHRWIAAGKITPHTREGGRPRVFVDRREIRKLLEPRPAKGKRK